MRHPRSAVREAVRILGGPTRASCACLVSNKAVYQWLDLGYVPTRRNALLMARATEDRGTPISAARLMALPEPGEATRMTG